MRHSIPRVYNFCPNYLEHLTPSNLRAPNGCPVESTGAGRLYPKLYPVLARFHRLQVRCCPSSPDTISVLPLPAGISGLGISSGAVQAEGERGCRQVQQGIVVRTHHRFSVTQEHCRRPRAVLCRHQAAVVLA